MDATTEDGSLGSFTRDELRARTREELAAFDALVSEQIRRERQAAIDPDIPGLLDALIARARAATVALACGPGVLEGDVHRAVELCRAAGAFRACPKRTAYDCPIEAEERNIGEVLKRLEEARIPGTEELRHLLRGGWAVPRRSPTAAEVVLGTIPGRRLRGGAAAPITPLWDTGPQRVVAAWLARRPAAVDIGGPELARVRGDEWCLLMGGEVGTGRTFAACSAILVGPAWFATAAEITTDRALEQTATTARLLILDDIGTEVYNDGRIAALLRARYAAHRRTIVSTNLRFEKGQQSILERYGKRVHDCFRDGLYLGFKGQSLRGAQEAPGEER